MQILGVTSQNLTEQAINECFGKGEVLTYQNIEQVQKALSEIYDQLEIKELASSFEEKASVTPAKKELTNEEKVKALGKEDMILNDQGEVVEAPRANKKCPCGSKKNYKKCACMVRDMERKTEFINRMTKKLLESEKPAKQTGMLML